MVTWWTRIGRALAQRERNEKQSDDARNAHQQKFAPNSSRMHPGRRTTIALAVALRGVSPLQLDLHLTRIVGALPALRGSPTVVVLSEKSVLNLSVHSV